MIATLRRLVEVRLKAPPATGNRDSHQEGVNLATAALLMEMMRSDFEVDEREAKAVEDSVRTLVSGDEEALRELLRRADRKAEESVSLFEFTSYLHANLSPAEKLEVVESLWRVAFADGRLDDHELHMMRKIRSLLHIPQKDFVAAKQRARDGKAGG